MQNSWRGGEFGCLFGMQACSCCPAPCPLLAQVDKLYVVKIGEVRLYKNNEPAQDTSFVHEVGGFSFFGEAALQSAFKCPYNVVVRGSVCMCEWMYEWGIAFLHDLAVRRCGFLHFRAISLVQQCKHN